MNCCDPPRRTVAAAGTTAIVVGGGVEVDGRDDDPQAVIATIPPSNVLVARILIVCACIFHLGRGKTYGSRSILGNAQGFNSTSI
jgi:hypothetical protein